LPLGPVGTHPTRVFDHDGGEVIYQLPNGLFGYRLVNKVGVVIDKGPTSIVKQNDAPPQFLAAIVNGVSCMNCHGSGILPKKDEILSFVNQNRLDFLADEVQKIVRIYPETRFLDTAIAKDNALYFDALKRIGVDPLKPDPVNQAFRHYNRSLSKIDIAAELGATQKAVETLLSAEPFKTKWQGVLANGVIAREEFNRLLPQAWAAIHQEAINLRFPGTGDFLVTASCMFANQLQMDQCLIDNRPAPPAPTPPPAPALR
jgi:serine/threonine-protein kinase